MDARLRSRLAQVLEVSSDEVAFLLGDELAIDLARLVPLVGAEHVLVRRQADIGAARGVAGWEPAAGRCRVRPGHVDLLARAGWFGPARAGAATATTATPRTRPGT